MPDFIVEGIKGTDTEKNLYFALGGESQAYFKYGVYAKKASQDGFEEIKNVFAWLLCSVKAKVVRLELRYVVCQLPSN